MSRLSFSYLITELLYYLGVKSRLQNDTFIALPRVSCTTWTPASTSRLSHPAAPAKMQHTVPGPDSSRGTVQPASHSSTSSTVPPATMTINLRNPMVFPAHTKINVICTSPIRVLFPHEQHFTLDANIVASFTVSHRTWILPTEPLDATFARDWDRLPCELRVKVLEYNLTSDRPIRGQTQYKDPSTFTMSKSVRAPSHEFFDRGLGNRNLLFQKRLPDRLQHN
jgi:hypothetical protein